MKKLQPSGCSVGCLHFVVTMFIFSFTLSASFYRVANKVSPAVMTQGKIGLALQPIVDFPLMTIAQLIWGEDVGGFGLLIWISNSLLFGFCFVFILNQLRKERLTSSTRTNAKAALCNRARLLTF